MATVKFLLNKPKDAAGLKKSEVAILVRISINRERRFVVSTKERIIPKYWDKSSQTAKANMTGHVELNLSLTRIKTEIVTFWRDNKSITLDALKQAVKQMIDGEEAIQKKSNDLELFIDQFIKNCESGKISRKANTIQPYKATFEHLKNFCRDQRYSLAFEEITLDFYYDFCQYCWDTLEHEDSTIGKSIKILKTFMQEALDQGLHNNVSFKKKQFKKFESEGDDVYLTEDEILAIYNKDLSARPDLIPSRNLFVFGCWVGLRYSDLSRIKPHHVKGNTLTINTQKTSETVVIPFHPIAKAVYDNGLPNPKSNPEFNADLKTICELAGIDTIVQKRTVKRGEMTVEYLPKHKMVTVHTARRSFATNCYKLGVPTRSIMAITGHKTEKAFNKYIKLSKTEHAAIMAEVFKQKPLMKIA